MTNLSLLIDQRALRRDERIGRDHVRTLRRASATSPRRELGPIAVRRLLDSDHGALAALAQRDSAPIPGGELLGAMVDGSLVAVISLEDGAVIADPFRESTSAVELLRLRARQLGRGGSRRTLSLPRLRNRFRGHGRGTLPSSPPGGGGRLLQL